MLSNQSLHARRIAPRLLWAAASVAMMGGLSGCNHQATPGTTGIAASSSSDSPVSAGDAGPVGVGYAQVVSVVPVRQDASTPQQECRDVVVRHTVPAKDQHQIAGTVIGAVAGGLLGHMFGGGNGRTLTTAAGAVGGGYAGKRIEENQQQNHVVSTVQRRCSTVATAHNGVIGYDVTYLDHGVTRTTRMDHDPGNRVMVEQSVSAVSDAH